MRQTSLRRERILALLEVHQRLSVASLAERCLVSIVTIRADLTAMQQAGHVLRTHGGAALKGPSRGRGLNVQDCEEGAELKIRLGAVAAGLISDGDNVFVESSDSTRNFARHLTGVRPITVMTNGLDLAASLVGVGQVKVLATGGRLCERTHSFWGDQAEASLNNYNFDKLFISPDGLDFHFGLTSLDEHQASLGRAAISRSRKVIVLAESSKICRTRLHRVASIDRVHTVVTDGGIDAQCHRELEARGINVVLDAFGFAEGSE